MRILHVSDCYQPRTGGIELHIRDLCAAQRQMGDEVDVLTMTTADVKPDDELVDSPDSVMRPRASASIVGKVRWLLRARRVVSSGRYDVVHVHCSMFSPLAFSVLPAARTPTVVTVHSLWRRYTALFRFADRCVRWSSWPLSWTAVSQVAAKSVSKAAVSPLHVDVLPNGLDVASWRTERPDRVGSTGCLRVISVMRLAARKRPMPLLRIFRATHDALPPGTHLHATIVGTGPRLRSMQRYIQRHGLADVVTLTGALPRRNIAALMVDADIFVAPATLESFGIAAAEAHAAGLPVLGRADTGLEQFLASSDDGVLVDSDRAMAHRLVSAARTGRLTPHRGASTALGDISRLDWSSVVAVTRRYYERVLGDGALVTSDASSQHRSEGRRVTSD
jgi:glycosyltransferase involved in cell wall biosynthesis